jgi:hypothetical protein
MEPQSDPTFQASMISPLELVVRREKSTRTRHKITHRWEEWFGPRHIHLATLSALQTLPSMVQTYEKKLGTNSGADSLFVGGGLS